MCSIPSSATVNASTAQVEVRGIDHPVPVTTARLA
jgi:hypothetical protein